MKKVTFKPPYRVGRKSGTTVLDYNGIEVVNFRDEEKALEYVVYLNTKEVMDNLKYVGAGKAMMDESDLVLKLPTPKNFIGGHRTGIVNDEVGVWCSPAMGGLGKSIPWYVIDHVNLIKDPIIEKHADNPLLGKDMAELWAKVARERESDPNYEPCCDKDNPCSCATFSPNMASPEDVRDFLDNRKVKYIAKEPKFKAPVIQILNNMLSNLKYFKRKNKQ